MADPGERPRGGPPPEGPTPRSTAEALRRRAAEIARAREAELPTAAETLSPEEAREVIHELQVYQIELELQNDELRRAQESLEAARARYFDLYDLAPVGYFTLSTEGGIREVNLTGARLLDVARAALIGRPLSVFILPEDQDSYYFACRKLVSTGGDHAFELRMAKQDGRPFWVWIEATVAHDDDGSPVLRMVMTDITARKMTEQALRAADSLRESWLYYRQIAESLPQLVWASGVEGAWDYLGPQWRKFTGFPEQEQLGLGWLRQVHPDDRAAASIGWDQAVATGAVFNAELRLRRHDGVYHRFQWRAVPLRAETGAITRWFGANTDLEDAVPGEPG